MDGDTAVEHPYNERYPIPQGTKALIVGTAPPPRFCKRPWSCEDDLDFDFFYGSGSNWMWGILSQAFDKPHALPETLSPEDCESEAKKLLECHGLWMRDVLARIKRKRGKETSAKDIDIATPTDLDFADFGSAFNNARDLTAIATTSEIAFEWLMQALKFQGFVSTGGKLELRTWQDFSLSNTALNSIEFWIAKHSQPATTFYLEKTSEKSTFISFRHLHLGALG